MIEDSKEWKELTTIRHMMERSSRFISLSGWSGVAAGICALIGAFIAGGILSNHAGYLHRRGFDDQPTINRVFQSDESFLGIVFDRLTVELLVLAAVIFVAAFSFAFLFTWLRSRTTGQPIWNFSAKRLLINTAIPLLAGGILLVKVIQLHAYALIAPTCLLFYGLSLINGSKYTLGEIRYLGYGQLFLGVISLWLPGYSLFIWSIGFGFLHIIYGIIMWWRNEKTAIK